MSFGTSILEGFRMSFGRVLGGQNPRFSHFFRCFFVVVFEARFGRRKNRAKKPKKTQKAIFLSRAPVYGTCLGRDYREGKHEILMRHLQQGLWCWCLVFDVAVLANLSRTLGTPSVGGGIELKTPGGGITAAHPLRKSWLKFEVGVRWMGNSSFQAGTWQL